MSNKIDTYSELKSLFSDIKKTANNLWYLDIPSPRGSCPNWTTSNADLAAQDYHQICSSLLDLQEDIDVLASKGDYI